MSKKRKNRALPNTGSANRLIDLAPERIYVNAADACVEDYDGGDEIDGFITKEGAVNSLKTGAGRFVVYVPVSVVDLANVSISETPV